MKNNRRDFIRKSASLAAALSISEAGQSMPGPKKYPEATAPITKIKWPISEGKYTPKLALGIPPVTAPEKIRMLKQIGVDHIITGGPMELPWTESALRQLIDQYAAQGITVCNLMIQGFPNTIYGRQGRDEEIEKIKGSLIAAGRAGIPVVEYNFYAHRLSEGYFDVEGRGGSGYLGFDYNRLDPKTGMAPKDLPPTEKEPAMKKEQLWENITYFLKEVIPVAEKAGVRMALHPNDPPAPVSRGSEQIMATFQDWKRFLDIVDSPSNGMTFDCGVSTEIGEDAVEVLHYMAARDRINHVHYRNCIVEIPSSKYVETFPDNGQVDMYAVMRELIRAKYRFAIYPEHPRGLDYDRAHPADGEYAGNVFNFAYARAMFQAVIYNEQG